MLDECACPRDADGKVRLPGDQQVRVRREKRRGKWTTVIAGLDPHATDMQALLKELRSALAAGGTIAKRDADEDAADIELQGDHCDRVLSILQDRGYRAKRAGG